MLAHTGASPNRSKPSSSSLLAGEQSVTLALLHVNDRKSRHRGSKSYERLAATSLAEYCSDLSLLSLIQLISFLSYLQLGQFFLQIVHLACNLHSLLRLFCSTSMTPGSQTMENDAKRLFGHEAALNRDQGWIRTSFWISAFREIFDFCSWHLMAVSLAASHL